LNSHPDVYHAISDANRRKLLDLLGEQERCVQELVPHLGITIGGVSQHLKILREAELIKPRQQGRYRFYRAEPLGLKEVHDWTGQYRQFWEMRLDRLGDYLDRTP
jgi:DNA-binding transcriptional ArsR family regulator